MKFLDIIKHNYVSLVSHEVKEQTINIQAPFCNFPAQRAEVTFSGAMTVHNVHGMEPLLAG